VIVYQESPGQIRDFPKVQYAQGIGALLYYQVHLLMKWMQDDPFLIITPALPTGTRGRIPMASSDSDSTDLGNTDRLGNNGSTTSPVNSPMDRTSQIETGSVSIETRAPNPFNKLIHIYRDKEISKPSHDSPMRVQEEKGPEKVSSLEPKVQGEEVLQDKTKSENGLSIKEPNESETEVDPNDKPKPEEAKKGSLQKEIDSFTADEKICNESMPDTSIFPNTQILDKQQVGGGPTRYNEAVRETNFEQIYTTGILGNKLTWGNQ
jgi:hypothetical protein